MTELQPVPVVIGTAGHIDHGKSALVEALCGTHPDRWQEEQERGITLDLGYAQMSFDDGLEIGLVDVPGHEKLVRKMVAGATGMGAALLVVACDDGVMPQTREHFEVLRLLGVDRGLVALTKADLADEETRMLVEEEVRELLAGSAWQDAPVLPVSAHQGEGMDALREALRAMALAARAEVDQRRAFRLPVQRSFALQGPGTVATGVTASGEVHAGDELIALPVARGSRVRRVQVHGRAAEIGRAGLRTALNLPDLAPEDCGRGTVLAAPGTACCGTLARIAVRQLPDAPAVQHDSHVLVLAGTAGVEAKLYFAPDQEGEEIFADLQLDEPMTLVPGERCILRRPSPGRNLGVARFLGWGKRRLRRKDVDERDFWLRVRGCLDDPAALVGALLETDGGSPKRAEDLAPLLGWKIEATREELAALVASGAAQKVGAQHYVGAGSAQELMGEVAGVIENFRSRNPGRLRIPIQRFRDRVGKDGWRVLDKMPEEQLALMGLRRRRGEAWEILGAEVDPAIAAAAEALRTPLSAGGLTPQGWEELLGAAGLDATAGAAARDYLVDSGRAVSPEDGLLFTTEAVAALRDDVVRMLQDGALDIPALRDRHGTTRKFLMPLLEYLDDCGVTERRGPNRLLRDPQAPIA